MKIRILLTLAGLAIGFAVPALSQEKDTVDPKIRQQIEALDTKYDEAFNKHDVASIAALFTEDAVEVTQNEVLSGREAIEKWYKSWLGGSSYSDRISKLDQVHTAIGIYPWAIGSWTFKEGSRNHRGFRFLVYLPTGGEWKISREVTLY
jgi:ketosteroid isomerase-like protein